MSGGCLWITDETGLTSGCFIFFFLQLPKKGWERKWWMIEGRQHLQNTPANALGVGTRDGWPEPTGQTLASVDGFRLWLSASKRKAPHACTPSPVHTCAGTHSYTHTGHTNEEVRPTPPTPTQSVFRHRKPNGSLQSDSGLQAGDWTRCSNKGIVNTCFFFQLKLQNTSSLRHLHNFAVRKPSSPAFLLGSLSVSLRPLLSLFC